MPNSRYYILVLTIQCKGLPDIVRIKQLKEEIRKNEVRLAKMMDEASAIWEETGLNPKDPSYLIEKTMRFEVAQKNIAGVFTSFKELIDTYKHLCQELEREEE